MSDMMGGFFEWAFGREYNNFPYREGENCALLNSGRAALACLLDNTLRPKRIFLPRFACDTLEEPCRLIGCPIIRYECSPDLSPILPGDINPEDIVILINYFGLTGHRVEEAARQCRATVIVDATTALYAPPIPGVSTFYSPRKFAPIPDGGIAIAPHALPHRPRQMDSSADRALYLLRRAEDGALAARQACDTAEAQLSHHYRAMSPLTRRMIQGIDFDAAAQRRLENYAILHQALAPLNRLSLPEQPECAPMCYPFVSGIPGLRDDLIDAGIALPLYWSEVIEKTPAHSLENQLARTLLPLPLDQRYGRADMQRLLHLILGTPPCHRD